MNLENARDHQVDRDVSAERARRWLLFAVTHVLPLAATLVPALYFVGRVHNEAYWHAMQVPPGVMVASFEDYVYGGFVALALVLIRSVSWLPFGPLGSWFILLVGLVILAATLAAIRKTLRAWLIERVVAVATEVRKWKSRQWGWNLKLAQSLLWLIQWLNGAFLGLLLAVLLISGAIVFAAKSGERQARLDLSAALHPSASIDEGGRPVARLRGRPQQDGGVALGCSSEWCAIVTVEVVRAEDVESFGPALKRTVK